MDIIEAANSDLVVAATADSLLGSGNGNRPFLFRISPSGAFLWATAYDFGNSGTNTIINQVIEVGQNNEIYAIGSMNNG